MSAARIAAIGCISAFAIPPLCSIEREKSPYLKRVYLPPIHTFSALSVFAITHTIERSLNASLFSKPIQPIQFNEYTLQDNGPARRWLGECANSAKPCTLESEYAAIAAENEQELAQNSSQLPSVRCFLVLLS